MDFFANNPFVKILSFWLPGLLAAFYAPWLLPVFVLIWALAGILVLTRIKTKTYPFDFYLSVFFAACFLLVAFLSVPKPAAVRDDKHTHRLLATVIEYPGEKTNSLQNLVKIDCCDSAFFQNKTLVVYFEKCEKAWKLQPGEQIAVRTQLQPIQNSGEPFAFDYQKMMANRGIFYSAYLPKQNFDLVENNKPLSIKAKAERFRFRLINLIKKHIKNEEQVQVISALTLGYRKELAEETRSYFASTGAMHVLAVSGLHVGMIYFFLGFVFAFLKRNSFGRFLFFIIIAGILWSYALLTGFSPSVLRATVMFSFILFGNTINRTASIYNSIAASAFVLLLFNPNLIFEVGFQLSYLAVISIVFFFPRFEKILSPENKLVKWLWQLLCVSFAAQLGVSALSVYYFHQFPTYFWLSNFVVVPAAYVILGSTFFLFLSSPIGWLAAATAKVLSGTTAYVIFSLRKIEQLPFSLTENISVTAPQLFCLIGLLASLMFFIKGKRKSYFFLANGFVLAFLVAGLTEKVQLFNQKKLVYYGRGQQVQLINGRKNYLICQSYDSVLPDLAAPILKLKLAPPTIIAMDTCKTYRSEDLIIQNNLIYFSGQTFRFGEHKISNNLKLPHSDIETALPANRKPKIGAGGSKIISTAHPGTGQWVLAGSSSFVVDL